MNFAAWNGTVEAVYDAAAEPGRWPDTLQRIAEAFEARGGLLLYRRGDGRYGTIASPALGEANAEYERHWQHLDVRAERVLGAIAAGFRDVQADHTFFTDAEVESLPIFQQFLLPRGFGWSMGVPVSPAYDVSVILTLVRAAGRPGFCEVEQARMLALSRHVERALSLSIRLMDADVERLGLADALDRFECGVFVLDAEQRVLLANDTARRQLGAGLVLSDGRFRLKDAAARQALRERLRAIEAAVATDTRPCEALVLEQADQGLILQILPLHPPRDLPALHSASAIVLTMSTGYGRPFDPALVRDAFRLTLGEARLAALVGAGVAPGEAAANLGIAESTGRTVLKRVFEKVGVSRQSELAALMGKLFMLRRTADRRDAS